MENRMTPLTGWAVVTVQPRSEWTAFSYIGRTREDARLGWIALFADADFGAAQFKKRLRRGEIRYARIVIREDSK